MIYGSVCSGIEAATVAWHPLGWRADWYSEVDPFCCELLRVRYPETPNLGDMTNIGKRDGQLGLLVGGTPCQSFSVNGLRKGLADARGDLSLHYVRLVELFQPRWFIWENVPGVLTVDGGEAFRAFLGHVGKLGYGVAWRVLDARHFGVAQRRRRLFLVGRIGRDGWRQAAAVVFDARGGGQDAGSTEAVRCGTAGRSRGGPVAFGWTGDATPKFGREVVPTLRAYQGGEGVGYIRDGKAGRFTALEWERLMGLPDNYTLIDYRGKSASDSARRQAVGNSFPVPILYWLGLRIDFLERSL